MTSWQTVTVLGSVQQINRMFEKLREMIDTEVSIPPELRASLHATLNKRLYCARERLFKQYGRPSPSELLRVEGEHSTRTDAEPG
ncbi:hypothetical protein [Bradyrhizobium sp. Tv2a-2]|uniref:hypothetical protein n=1 Tax=Bradyrhizobium sp. Tv2a-2 TaxID=113395 RepID=UPI0005607689|nr:hypothetical protein [Bradyrhizobium sp. Tv2a-2]